MVIYMKLYGNKKIHRVLLPISMLAFVFTSSSVYAQNADNITTILTEPTPYIISDVNSNSIPADLTNDLPTITTNDTTEETTIITPPTPLVQSMTNSAASTSSLYETYNNDDFFANSVFIGDSITVGFSAYCNNHSDSMATDTTHFLAKESCSAKVATSSTALTKHADIMPVYNDKVTYFENAIAQMPDIEKVFICFGMNDLVMSTPEQYIYSMDSLIENILSKSPDVSIYCISVPCVIDSVQSGLLCNDSISEANQLLQAECSDKGWGFINLSEYLMNSSRSICPEYSSDGFIHENNSAYEIWVKVLRNYAYELSVNSQS